MRAHWSDVAHKKKQQQWWEAACRNPILLEWQDNATEEADHCYSCWGFWGPNHQHVQSQDLYGMGVHSVVTMWGRCKL